MCFRDLLGIIGHFLILVEISVEMGIMFYSTAGTTIKNEFGNIFGHNTFYWFAIACHHPQNNAPKDINENSTLSDVLDK